jgi:Xaa-Pro dipeptidase
MLAEIQSALQESQLDGWLFFDHHKRDPLAYRILGIPDDVGASRRWYYFIPAIGEPRKLVHQIEAATLDSLDGQKRTYSSWQEQEEKLKNLLAGVRKIAMQYSPQCAIPYISLVDAGTVERIRALGVEVVSSADLVQLFEARWTEAQLESHLKAGELVDATRRDAFRFIGERVVARTPVGEYEVQQFIRSRFAQFGLTTDHGPIVAVNGNASDPHYEPKKNRTASIKPGDVVLIDLWAKLDVPKSVYYDVTWTGFCGPSIPDKVQNVFEVVRGARERASSFVIGKAALGEQIFGFEVDDQARGYIAERGFGPLFFHRTGHSIGTEVHGTGANMDNWESHDDRRILSGCCFSVEPGVYLPEFGIRSEVNVYMGSRDARVTGEEQTTLVCI